MVGVARSVLESELQLAESGVDSDLLVSFAVLFFLRDEGWMANGKAGCLLGRLEGISRGFECGK